jgi:hypothetical protein
VKDKHLGDSLKGELTDIAIIEKARELSEKKQSFEVDLLIYRKRRATVVDLGDQFSHHGR